MLNWNLVAEKLSESRPNHEGPYRVALYSRMREPSGQDDIARIHIKRMELAVRRDSRFKIVKRYQDFGVTSKFEKMLCYQRLIEDCRNGAIDLIMVFDLSRLGQDYSAFMKNAAPVAEITPDVGFLFLGDQLFCLGSQAYMWAEKMARGDYSSCQLPYFVGFMP